MRKNDLFVLKIIKMVRIIQKLSRNDIRYNTFSLASIEHNKMPKMNTDASRTLIMDLAGTF